MYGPGPSGLEGQRIYKSGDLGRQENEPYCGKNPNNDEHILCAFNWYGFSDRPLELGDAWIAVSEKIGNKWYRHPLPGTNLNNPLFREFAADPIVAVFPGGAMVFALVGDRGGNSAMVVWRAMELNRESGVRYVFEAGARVLEELGGVHFIDKPAAKLIPAANGGFTSVTMTLEEKDPVTGENLVVTRDWPNFRGVVSFADFGGGGQNIRTWSVYSDDFFASTSNKSQISNTSGLDQGLFVENKGNELLYVWRRFDSGEGRASIMGAHSRNGGRKIGKARC